MADDSEPRQVCPNTKKPAIDPTAVDAAQIAAQNAEKRTATPAAPTNQQQVVNEDDCNAALRWADKAPPAEEAPPAKIEDEDRTCARGPLSPPITPPRGLRALEAAAPAHKVQLLAVQIDEVETSAREQMLDGANDHAVGRHQQQQQQQQPQQLSGASDDRVARLMAEAKGRGEAHRAVETKFAEADLALRQTDFQEWDGEAALEDSHDDAMDAYGDYESAVQRQLDEAILVIVAAGPVTCTETTQQRERCMAMGEQLTTALDEMMQSRDCYAFYGNPAFGASLDAHFDQNGPDFYPALELGLDVCPHGLDTVEGSRIRLLSEMDKTTGVHSTGQ